MDHNRTFTLEKGKWPRLAFIRFVPWKIEGHSECCIHKTYSRHMVSTCSWLSNTYFVETYQDAQEDAISPWNRPHWIPCFWMNCHPSPPHKPVRVALPVKPCWSLTLWRYEVQVWFKSRIWLVLCELSFVAKLVKSTLLDHTGSHALELQCQLILASNSATSEQIQCIL